MAKKKKKRTKKYRPTYTTGSRVDMRTGGRVKAQVGGIDLLNSGAWTSANVTAALTGGLYNSVGGAEGVKNLGIEFDESVVDESAEMLNDMLSYWEGLPGPMGTNIGEGIGITQDDVEKAEEMVIEWFQNCPSLLFVSAVSGRMEEKYGKNFRDLDKKLTKPLNPSSISNSTSLYVSNLLVVPGYPATITKSPS